MSSPIKNSFSGLNFIFFILGGFFFKRKPITIFLKEKIQYIIIPFLFFYIVSYPFQICGFEIKDYTDFECLLDKLLADKTYLEQSGKAAGDYVKHNAGALDKIMQSIPF